MIEFEMAIKRPQEVRPRFGPAAAPTIGMLLPSLCLLREIVFLERKHDISRGIDVLLSYVRIEKVTTVRANDSIGLAFEELS